MGKPVFHLSPEGVELMNELITARKREYGKDTQEPLIDERLLTPIYVENVCQAFKFYEPAKHEVRPYTSAVDMFRRVTSIVFPEPELNETKILTQAEKKRAERKLMKIEGMALIAGVEDVKADKLAYITYCDCKNCEAVDKYIKRLSWWNNKRVDSDGKEYGAKNNYYEPKEVEEAEHPF